MRASTSWAQRSPRSPPAAPSEKTRKEGHMSTTLKRHQMFIGGKWTDSSGGDDQEIINPATGKVIAHVPKGTAEDVDRAVAAAVKAYDDVWFDTTPRERSEMLLKLADAILEHGEALASLESENVGKPRATTL